MKQSSYAAFPPEKASTGSALMCVAGNNIFNNEVLSGFLEAETGLPCYCIQYEKLSFLYDQLADETILVFLDCSTMGTPATCDQACISESTKNDHCMVVCFNVSPDEKAESRALTQGIRGIVYDHQPLDLYVNAAKAVLEGEFWYPREVLENQIMAESPPTARMGASNDALTGREQEILTMLSAGMRNRDIAKKLCISPHTVKTHAYNLYRKLNVSNRFEATQWFLDNQRDTTG